MAAKKLEQHEPVMSDDTEQVPPLNYIGYEAIRVAGGESVQLLRTKVAEVYPKDKEAGQALLKQLLRLRDAAEVALTTGREMQSGLENV